MYITLQSLSRNSRIKKGGYFHQKFKKAGDIQGEIQDSLIYAAITVPPFYWLFFFPPGQPLNAADFAKQFPPLAQ